MYKGTYTACYITTKGKLVKEVKRFDRYDIISGYMTHHGKFIETRSQALEAVNYWNACGIFDETIRYHYYVNPE